MTVDRRAIGGVAGAGPKGSPGIDHPAAPASDHNPKGRPMAEQHNTTRGSATGTIAVFAALPVLYVLSLGPVVKLADADRLGPRDGPVVQAAQVFYRPLEWCHNQKVPLIAEALDWYVRLWRG
jgi:hypothetical protein